MIHSLNGVFGRCHRLAVVGEEEEEEDSKRVGEAMLDVYHAFSKSGWFQKALAIALTRRPLFVFLLSFPLL